jgi:hypothetical protein
MKDISYHILDIVQNSLNAGATLVMVEITENARGEFRLTISDNGRGMGDEMLRQVTDPFFTTSTTKKVGLGIPLLKQNAELTGGSCRVESTVNKGTVITAVFNKTNIDMIPLGDMASTFKTLIAGNPDVDFVYRHQLNENSFELNTADIREGLDGIRLDTPEVLNYISEFIHENLNALI